MAEKINFYFIQDDYGDGEDVYSAQVNSGSTFREVYETLKSEMEGMEYYPTNEVSFMLHKDNNKRVIPPEALVEQYNGLAEDGQLNIAVLSPSKGTVLEVHIYGHAMARLRTNPYENFETALLLFEKMKQALQSKNYNYITVNKQQISPSEQLALDLRQVAKSKGSQKLRVEVVGQKQLTSQVSDKQQSKSSNKPESKPHQQEKPQLVQKAELPNPMLKPQAKVEAKMAEKPQDQLVLKEKKNIVRAKGTNKKTIFYIDYINSSGKSQTITYEAALDKSWEQELPEILQELISAGFPWDMSWDFKNRDQLGIEYNHQIISGKALQQRLGSYLGGEEDSYYLKFNMRYLGG